jgi:NAD(P)-dependent dehydrogenase (short-subunit alcohol dehydrogenase family)
MMHSVILIAVEVARFGIETSIVMPGPFTVGTQHFPNAAQPEDGRVKREYARYDDALARNQAAADFSDYGDLAVTAVADAQRRRLYPRMGYADFLAPRIKQAAGRERLD